MKVKTASRNGWVKVLWTILLVVIALVAFGVYKGWAAPSLVPFVQNSANGYDVHNEVIVWWQGHPEVLSGQLWLTDADTQQEVLVKLVWIGMLPASTTSIYKAVLPMTERDAFVITKGVIFVGGYEQEIAGLPLILTVDPTKLYIPMLNRLRVVRPPAP